MADKKFTESKTSDDLLKNNVSTDIESVDKLSIDTKSHKTLKGNNFNKNKNKHKSKKGNRLDNNTSLSNDDPFNAPKTNDRDISVGDKFLDDSSTSTLPTTTEFSVDTGNQFYSSLTNQNNEGDPVVAKYKSTTTLFKDRDNTINRTFKAVDQLSLVVSVPKTYAVNDENREVMVDDTSIKYDYFDTYVPSIYAYNGVPNYLDDRAPRMAHRNYVVNLDGALQRGKITATDRTSYGETVDPSPLDKFNTANTYGIIKMTPTSEVAPLVDDIGVATTQLTTLPMQYNKVKFCGQVFGKLGYYNKFVIDYGYQESIMPEFYLSDSVLNKSNMFEDAFDKITKYNIENSSMLRAITSLQTFAATMNAITPLGTFLNIMLYCLSQCAKYQVRNAGQISAPDSTFANIFMTNRLSITATQEAIAWLRRAIVDIPYNKKVFNAVVQLLEPTKMLDKEATEADNTVIIPTVTLGRSGLYDFYQTTSATEAGRIPKGTNNEDSTNKASGWNKIGLDDLKPYDQRFLVSFKTVLTSASDYLPHSAWLDYFLEVLMSSTFFQSYLPVEKYEDYKRTNIQDLPYGGSNNAYLSDLNSYLQQTGSNRPNLSFSNETFGKSPNTQSDDLGVNTVSSNSVYQIIPNASAQVRAALLPMVSVGSMTAFMLAFVKFIANPSTRMFLDNFVSNLNKAKPYFITLRDKIGLPEDYELLSDSNMSNVNFDLSVEKKFEYNEQRVKQMLNGVFVQSNILATVEKDYKNAVRVRPLINPVVITKGSDSLSNVTNLSKRLTLFVGKDGQTYANPLTSGIRLIVYNDVQNKDKVLNTSGFNVNTDTICFNCDEISVDISQNAKYIGNHIMSYYPGGNLQNSYYTTFKCYDYTAGNWNFYFARGINPDRKRFIQRGIVMNTTDGIYQSPVYAAFVNPYLMSLSSIHSRLSSIASSPILSIYPASNDFMLDSTSLIPKFIRNKTGLAVFNTLRRTLIDGIFKPGQGYKSIKKKYILN